MAKAAELTGPELVELIGDEHSMDFFYNGDPDKLTEEHLRELVTIHRRERAAFIAKEQS